VHPPEGHVEERAQVGGTAAGVLGEPLEGDAISFSEASARPSFG